MFRVRPPPKVNWIQICILCIGVFIGVAAFIATIALCCLYSKYKRRIRRSNIKIVEAPVRALIPASLPPGKISMYHTIFTQSKFFCRFHYGNGPSCTLSDGCSSLPAGRTLCHRQQRPVRLMFRIPTYLDTIGKFGFNYNLDC